VFPVLLNKLFQNPKVGFAWGVRVAAFIILVLLVIANLVLKTRLPSAKEREAMGMPKRRKIEVGPILRDVPYMLATFGLLDSCVLILYRADCKFLALRLSHGASFSRVSSISFRRTAVD
jgi:hypothetical protein